MASRHTDGPACWDAANGELICTGHGRNDLISDRTYGDFDLHLEFLLEEEANSGVYLRGRMEVQLIDTQTAGSSQETCGAIYGLIAPAKTSYHGAGRWNTLDVKLIGQP